MHRVFLAAGVLALALSLAACGGSADATTDADDRPASGTCLEGTPDCDDTGILDGDAAGGAVPSAGMCAPEMPDCIDTGVLPGSGSADGCLSDAEDCDDAPGRSDPLVVDVFDPETAIAPAQELLGRAEAELAPEVRISRRGDEQMMLTEDDVLGRMTVEP